MVEVDNTTDHTDEKDITSFVLPSNADGAFAGAGLPYYENTIAFNANVPYELKGWSNSRDLSKLDQDELRKMVEDKLKQEADYIISNSNLMFQSYFKQFVEINKAEYKSNDKLNRAVSEIKKFFDFTLSFNIPENVILKLYVNNRVATLEYVNGKRRGKSYFDINVKGDGVEGVSHSFKYFHIPKGSNELEIIR